MSRLLHNKKVTACALIGLLLVAGGAYAYWTQTGAGSGEADTGTTSELVILQVSTPTGLAPAAGSQPLSGTIENPSEGTVHVTSITATLTSTGLPAGCTVDDYLINDPVVDYDADILGGDVDPWTGPSIEMVDTGENQDACKGATVTIAYTSA